MNKKVLSLIILGIFLFSILPTTSAYFFKSHEYWTLKGVESVDSPITRLCREGNNFEAAKTGVLSADIPVLHYFSDKVQSYIGTHSRGAQLGSCLDRSDTDEERCFCYFEALHWVAQDRYSHLKEGITAKYLNKYFALNFLGHMIIERDFEKKQMELVKDDPIITSGALANYDDTALDYLFTEFGGNPRLLELLSDQAGIDLTNDAKIFRAGYQGEGFYSTVYQDKINLPWWFWVICIILVGLGLVLIFLSLKFGENGFKWLIFLEGLALVLIGLLILFSVFTGVSWKVTTTFIEIPPKFGYLSVSQEDVVYYNNLVQQATNEYLRTGNAIIDDGSGLSYTDRTGKKVTGALEIAQRGAIFVYLGVLIAILLSNFALMKRAFTRKHKARLIGKIGTWFIGIFTGILIIMVLYIVGALFFG